MADPKTISLVPVDVPADDDDEFKGEQWIYPASNDKGEGMPIGLRIPLNQYRLISEYIAQRRFPYGDKSDLIRHAIAHHLDRLALCRNHGQESLHAQVAVINRLIQEQEKNREFIETIANLERFVQLAMQSDDREAASEMVRLVKEQVRKITSPFWRKRYEREIQRRVGFMLDSIDAEIVPTLPPHAEDK